MLDYGMTKTAQLGVSRGFAEAVAGTGVTVNAVLPGTTRSEILGDFMAKQAEAQGMTREEAERGILTAMRPTRLLGRCAIPDQVANMHFFAVRKTHGAGMSVSVRVDHGGCLTID